MFHRKLQVNVSQEVKTSEASSLPKSPNEQLPPIEPEPVKRTLFSGESPTYPDVEDETMPCVDKDDDRMNKLYSIGISGGINFKVEFVPEEFLVRDITHDSDVEEKDEASYTRKRILSKISRQAPREDIDESDLKEVPGNFEVYQEFKEHLERKNVLAGKKDNSTNRKHLGHIVGYPDSLASNETKADPDFRLNQLTNFRGVCKQLKHPLQWVQETSDGNPGRAVEKLKSHAAFREFLLHKLGNTDMADNFEMITKKMGLRDGIDLIDRSITQEKLFAQYGKLLNNERVEARAAKFVLNPNRTQDESDSVSNWNKSDEAQKAADHHLNVYNHAMAKGSIKGRAFNSFANYVRFLLCLSDKNRAGATKFYNRHFHNRQKQYYPTGYDGFACLPEGWNTNVPPSPGEEPSQWLIRIPGNIAILVGCKASRVFII